MKDPLELALEHGRQLFVYHATQRHGSLNFYFALATALLGGFAALFTADKIWALAVPAAPLLATGLCVVAVTVMQFFIRLDLRNAFLVDADKKLLSRAEEELFKVFAANEVKLIENSDRWGDEHRDHKYSFVVEKILKVFQAAALVAMVASWGYWTWVQTHPAGDTVKVEISRHK